MKSSFFEFNVATSAMFTARGALNTVTHNVANASTRGYSRQIVEQRASWPLSLNTGKGMVGTGSEIYGVKQIRNTYLDKKYWANTSYLGEYSSKQSQLSLMETILNEMADAGLKSQFNDFFARIQELTKDAGDATYRTNLLQLAESISTYFDSTYQALKRQQTDANEEIKATTTIINSIGRQIAALNKQISQYELNGQRANDLRDQRALLVDELSTYVNVSVDERELNDDYAAGMYPNPEDRGKSNKQFVVMLNGHALVDGFDYNELECRERKTVDPVTGATIYTSKNPEDVPGLYDIYWKKDGAPFNLYSSQLTGELRALIDIRDGNNQNYLKFGPTKAGASITAGSVKVTLTPPADRPDWNPDGGIIKIQNLDPPPTGGGIKEYAYKSYTYNPITGQAEFTLVDSTLPNPIPGNYEVTVGEASKYKGIPYYMNRLNELARTVVQAMNTGTKFRDGAANTSNFTPGIPPTSSLNQIAGMFGGHISGYNADGNQLDTLFFTYYNSTGGIEAKWDATFDIYMVTAETIRVNNDLLRDPRLLQASDEQTGGISNNNVVLSFLKVNTEKGLFKEGKLGDYIIGMTGELGVEFKQTKNFVNSYTDMTVSIDNQRMSVSGVNLDEEMTAMVMYQQQFVAASKLINTIDQIYDLLINRLGNF